MKDSDKCALTGVGELPNLPADFVETQNHCTEQMNYLKCCSQQENDKSGNKNIYTYENMCINK